jgi:hypothetical protein
MAQSLKSALDKVVREAGFSSNFELFGCLIVKNQQKTQTY